MMHWGQTIRQFGLFRPFGRDFRPRSPCFRIDGPFRRSTLGLARQARNTLASEASMSPLKLVGRVLGVRRSAQRRRAVRRRPL